MIRVIIPLLAALLLVTGCGPNHIDNFETLRFDEKSEILDTQENREVLEVLHAYRIALQNRESENIESLISDEYYENGGTTNTSDDDYGRTGLPTVLSRLEERVKSVKLDIVVKDMKVQDDRAWVVFEYLWNYKYQVDDVPKWESGRDVNRIDLVRDDGGLWKITRGL